MLLPLPPLYLSLAERQDGGGVVQLLSPDHRLHVEDLAADALHQHREEVGVTEVQRALKDKQKEKVRSSLAKGTWRNENKHCATLFLSFFVHEHIRPVFVLLK